MVGHLTIARVAEGLDVSWNTANHAVLAEGKRVLINDPGRFDKVTTIGVDEHVWRHTRRGELTRGSRLQIRTECQIHPQARSRVVRLRPPPSALVPGRPPVTANWDQN